MCGKTFSCYADGVSCMSYIDDVHVMSGWR